MGDLIEGQTEMAKAVDRNQLIKAPIRVRVGSQRSDEVQLSVPPGAGPPERSLHQIPRFFQLAGGDLPRLRPATTRLRQRSEVAPVDVVGTMGAADGAQPAVADSDSKRLDVAANAPRSLGQLDYADLFTRTFCRFKVTWTCLNGDLVSSGAIAPTQRAVSGRQLSLPGGRAAVRLMGSLPTSVRKTKGRPYSRSADFAAGRTPSSNRPLLRREPNPLAAARLTDQDVAKILQHLTQRDLVLLTALHDYRYLDTRLLELLFFPSARSTQIRIKELHELGLIHRWKLSQPPGNYRLHSLILLSARGARVLAASLSEDPRRHIKRAEDAMFHCFNLTHDLEANSFFVDLAVASRDRTDEGLYHWVGEAQQRVLFRTRSREGADIRQPASDGWGRYLAPAGSITFDLEWDRGTESMKRLGDKVRGYLEHFSHRRNAESRHILFVLPTIAREHHLHALIGNQFVLGMLNCCRFWLTSRQRLESEGPLGHLWLHAPPGKEPDVWKEQRLDFGDSRLALDELSALPDPGYAIHASIGKQRWWDWRRGGGEAA